MSGIGMGRRIGAALALVVALVWATAAQAAVFNEGFTTRPTGLASPATVFTMPLGGQDFLFSMAGGDMAWDNASIPGNPALNVNSLVPATLTITRVDGEDFILSSLVVDVVDAASGGRSVAVQRYRNGIPQGPVVTAAAGARSTLSFSNVAIDEVRLTSNEFVSTLVDDIQGDSGQSAPTVTSLSPTAGPTTGANTVVITGTNFTGVTAVVFGGSASSIYAVNSATQITATVPAGTAGPVNVRVTTAGGTSATGAGNQYTYVAAPTVSAISPVAGPTGGGTTVVITGTGFATAGATGAVRFDGIAATYTINSNTQITAIAPAHSAGTVDVQVTGIGGTSATSTADRFTYVAAPTVTSVTSSSVDGRYKVGDTIGIQVDFSGPVIVTGTPQLTLETGVIDHPADYIGGSGTSTLVFVYTVRPGDTSADLDYIAASALVANGGTIEDAAGNIAVLTLPAPGTVGSLGANKNLVIDGVVPVIVSVGVPANGTYRAGDTLAFTVAASENVTVAGGPRLALDVGGTTRYAGYVAGSGTASLVFTYVVDSGAVDADGIVVGALELNGGTLGDGAGNNMILTLNAVGSTTGVLVDAAVPTVTSIAPAGGATATATSVDFTVTFSEAVTGVDTGDFVLTATGSATGTVSGLSGSNASYTVTVAGISGTGTLRLDLTNPNGIQDGAANPMTGGFTAGSVHTVAIPTAPGAPTIGTATAGDGQASVTFTAPASNGGSAITTYTATASPGGAFGTCAGPAACTATVTGLSNGTAYTFTVTATNAIGTSVASGASNSVTPKGDQTISFANPGAQDFGTTPTLTATATSTLTPTFSSTTTGVCTITPGGALTFVTAGSCTIEAGQAGDTAWNAATTVAQTFTVNAVVPGAPTIGSATAGNTQATVTFTAPASTGGTAIIAGGYTVTANPGGATGTGSSSPITVTGLVNGVAYTFTVTATNSAGEGPDSAASNAVTPAAPQIITFDNPGTQDFGTTPMLTAASSAGGGYPVTFTSATTGVCTITAGGTLSFVSIGSCTINADQAGDGGFLPAPQVSQTFAVAAVVPAAPTAVTATPGDTQASVAFAAPVFTGGAAITSYTVTVSPADVAPVNGTSSPIVVAGLTNGEAYTFTVTASNPVGTGAASAASNSVTPAATQTITFPNPGAQDFGTTPTLSASADSGLTPVFTSATPGVCTITGGGALTFVTIGTCTINANQPGNGSYTAATQVTSTFAVNAVVPGAPIIGTATATGAGQASIAFTAPAFTGGTPITGYVVTASPGGATASGSGAPIDITGLTPGTTYTFTVQAINSVGSGSSSAASNAVTPIPALVAGAVSATVGYGASSTAITLDITGSPTSVAVGMAPTHGTAVASGTTISYTPASGYAGPDSFTYTATDPYSTTPPATVTIDVSAPTVAITTAALADAVGNAAYTQTLAASGGAAPYGYAVTAGTLPAGLALSPAGQLAGTPTQIGTFNFTVTATDSSTGTGPFTATQSFTLRVDAPLLTAGPTSTTVAYGATAAPVTLDIVGTPTSVAVVTPPLHGSAVVSGGTISYTPAAGYAGPDGFTYTASDAFTTTAPASASIAVSAPVLAMAPGSLPAATASNAYAQSLSASGGAAPYSYAVTGGALPPGVTLSATGGLTGTPTRAGDYGVTITATDSSTGIGPFTVSQAYVLVVEAPQVVVGPSTLPAATGASDYRQALTASGGAAPYRFALSAGELPPGLVLGEAGEIGGEATASGDYAFTVQATDANGFIGHQAYRLTVEAVAQAIEAFVATPAEPVYAQGGTFTVAASGGASGNPVVFASTTAAVCRVQDATVTMLAAGVCSLTADQAGNAVYRAAAQVRLDVAIAAATPALEWLAELGKVYGDDDFELPDPRSTSPGAFTFTSSNPAVATVNGRTVHLVGEGTAVLVATQAASGSYTAASAQVQLVVSSRPDPTSDRQVAGGLQAQVDATVRFAQVQQANIRDRLRQVRGGRNASSTNLTLAYAGGERMPGLSVPVGQAAQGAIPALPQGWGVWLAGTATFGKAGRHGSAGGAFDFDTGGITLGADHVLGEHALLGMAASWGRQGTDFDGTPSKVDADQRSLAVYGLWRAGEHLFLDGMLATGRLDFELARWSEIAGATAHARRDGDQWFGSLTFGYEHRGTGGTTLTGYGRYDGHRADLDGYAESGLGAYDLVYGDQRVDNSALAVGLEGSHPFQGARSSWRPFWTLEYRVALENQGEASINYLQRPLANDYTLSMRSYNDDMLALGGGVDLQLDSGWMFSLLLGHEQGRNAMRSNSIGLQVRYGSPGGVAPVYVDDDRLGQLDDRRGRCNGRGTGCNARGIQP